MRNTWRHFLCRLAAGCAVSSSLAWSSAMCYAVQLAYDSADDPAYADGWQGRVVNAAGTAVIPSGDNGGFGFTQWDFTSLLTWQGDRFDYTNTNFHAIDDGRQAGTHYSNPHNAIGRAWALGSAPMSGGVPRAGRGFSLAVGETLRIVFDNPTRRQFWKGYQINLRGGTGGVDGNMCYGGVECVAGSGTMPKAGLSTFEYFSYGGWTLNDASTPVPPPAYPQNALIPILDTDTAAAGAVFTIERIGAETYVATLDSFDPLKADFGPMTRTFENPGAEVDWIEFTFFNPMTDLTPTLDELGTDFYIRSMEITAPDPAGVPGDYNDDGVVNAADYVIARKHLGAAFQLDNEVTGVTPGNVTDEDLAAWRERFGDPGAGMGSLVAGTTVPEPGTWVYLVAIVAWIGIERLSEIRERQR
jgi:hypothetical protein